MKKLVTLILATSLLTSNIVFADCKWAEGVKKVEGGYLYSSDCHGRVGILVKDLEDREIEVVNLRKGLELKDLALKKADERITLWRDESYEQFERLQKQTEFARKNETLWFVLGVVVTGAAVWSAGQLR